MNKKENVSQARIISNIGFIISYLFKLRKKLFLFRIPQIFLSIASPLINAYLFAQLLNKITENTNIKSSIFIVILIAATNFFISLVQRIIGKYDQREQEKTMQEIKFDLGETVSELPYSDIEQPRVKDFISLAKDTSVFSIIIDAITSLFNSIIGIITYSSILLFIQPWIIIVIILNVIIQLIINKLKLNYNNKWRLIQEPFLRKLWYYEGLLCDPRCGKELRVNMLKNWIVDKVEGIYDNDCAPIIKTNARKANFLDLVAQVLKIAENILIYIFLGYKVIFGNMLIGDFTFYLSNTTNLTNALASFSNNISELNECGTFVNEFRFFMDLFKTRNLEFGDKNHEEAKDFSIEFKNVSFRYPNTDNLVLKNVSFKVHAGEKLSLVGINGSGKTTIIKLLCRFYKPTVGAIYIGNININEYSTQEYTKLLGVVFQDYKLFSFSVLDNIIMGDGIDISRVECSINNSGLKEKIENLNEKENTYVYKDFNENGVEFSGGEGQKLSVCRTLYKNAPIIILDEPTASLDPLAEYDMYNNFYKVVKNKTAIFVSHRLSSTRFTDKIAVMQSGVLCEFGNHSELMKIENGIYRNMFCMQQQYYT